MDDHIKTLKYPWTIDITVIRARSYRVNIYMEFEMAGKIRETLVDPMYKRIDKMGRVYVDRNLAEQEVLLVVVRPKPEDKINYIKVGRGP
jgi:ribosome-associated toxin RatA of RatAB toxin-antitoxin module